MAGSYDVEVVNADRKYADVGSTRRGQRAGYFVLKCIERAVFCAALPVGNA
jgi:hypothetical protein